MRMMSFLVINFDASVVFVEVVVVDETMTPPPLPKMGLRMSLGWHSMWQHLQCSWNNHLQLL